MNSRSGRRSSRTSHGQPPHYLSRFDTMSAVPRVLALPSAADRVSLETMSNDARTCLRGYRYYGFSIGSPEPAARV